MTSFLDKRGGAAGDAKAKKATLRRARSLSETKNWYADRYQSVTVQRNILFIFTLILLAGLGLSVMMVAKFTNAKTFEPFVMEVDQKTGVVTQVSTHNIEKYTADEAVVRSLLVQYLRARESYDFDTYYYNYYTLVRLFSSKDVSKDFRTQLAAANKDSVLNFGRTKRREVLVKSITFLDNSLKKAQARLQLTDLQLPNKLQDKQQSIVVLITCDFKNLDLTPEERYINPLGFQVLSYLAEKEIVDDVQK